MGPGMFDGMAKSLLWLAVIMVLVSFTLGVGCVRFVDYLRSHVEIEWRTR